MITQKADLIAARMKCLEIAERILTPLAYPGQFGVVGGCARPTAAQIVEQAKVLEKYVAGK